MMPVLFGIAVAVAVLAVPFAVRRVRTGRAVPPRHVRLPGAARPEVQPRGGVTGPFGYDSGVAVEPREDS